jgi:uncharacterized protein involved in exopolysaccharide biosynthesis
MSIQVLFGILLRNWFWLLAIPLVTAVSIFFFTRKQDKEYAADTIIYTGINSNFNLKDENQSDYFAASKAFSNLLTLFNSRATKQEVAFHLLARHLSLSDFDPAVLNWQTYVRLQELIDQPTRKKLVGASFHETVQKITNLYNTNDSNVIYLLLNSEVQGYSLKALSRLSANQIGNSDLMKVEYVSNDAAMCRQTLEILSAIFIRRHKELMEGQNESVIDYFQTATTKAAQRLDLAEKEHLAFHKKHGILNYQEQVTNVTSVRQQQVQEFNALEMQYAGTHASIQEIERNLQKEGSAIPNSQEILQLRNQLLDLNIRIWEYEILSKEKVPANPAGTLATLKRRAEATEAQLGKSLDSYSAQSNHVQNLSAKELLNDWLKETIQAEKLRAQMLVMRKQNKTFAQEAEKMAPLGVALRKLEREKELAEKEYFSLLNGLSESRLTQQNIELTSQLKVVDQPVTPVKPLSSRRLILVAAGAMGTFFMVLATLIGTELLDFSLKNPAQAAKRTGLPVFGLMPTFNHLKQHQERQIKSKEDQLARQLLLKMQQKKGTAAPYLVGVLSNQSGEGKTTLIQSLVSSMNGYGLKTLALLPGQHPAYLIPDHCKSYYAPRQSLVQSTLEANLPDWHAAGYDLVVVEFPALLESNYPVSMLPALDLILLTLKATNTWQQADSDILARIKTVTEAPIEVLLNGVLPKYMEDYKSARPKKAARDPETAPEPEAVNQQEMVLT